MHLAATPHTHTPHKRTEYERIPHSAQRRCRYIDLAAAGYDIVELLAMEQDLQVVRIRIHLLQNSPLWKVIVYVAILVHVLLPIVAETPDVCGEPSLIAANSLQTLCRISLCMP